MILAHLSPALRLTIALRSLGSCGCSTSEVGPWAMAAAAQLLRQGFEELMRPLRKQLEQAEAELFTSRLSAMTSHSAARQMAVTRLRRMVRESEKRERELQKWIRNYDSLVEPLLKKLDGIQHFATHDLPKAASSLAQAERTLDDYTRVAMEGGVDPRTGAVGKAGEEEEMSSEIPTEKGEDE